MGKIGRNRLYKWTLLASADLVRRNLLRLLHILVLTAQEVGTSIVLMINLSGGDLIGHILRPWSTCQNCGKVGNGCSRL